MPRKIFELFTNFIFKNPTFVCFATFITTFVFPIILLFVFPLGLGNNPEKGFETDGTPYSGPRLTWNYLQPFLLQGSQVEFINEIEKVNIIENKRIKRSWADDLVNSMFSVINNCYDEPIPAMSFLSQFVVEIENFDNLFSIEFIQQLCSLKEKLSFELSDFSSFSLYKNIWSWPNFINCLAPNHRDNCSQIKEEDIDNFHSIFLKCLPHRQTILDCGHICGQSKSNIEGIIKISGHRYSRQSNFNKNKNNDILFEEEEEKENNENEQKNNENKCFEEINICTKIPKECNDQMWFDLFYRILPEDVYSKPLLLNNFLPFYTFSAYRLQGINVPLNLFVNFESKIKKIAQEKSSIFQLKGLSLDTKRDLLLEAALRDSTITLFSALIIFLLLSIYSLSLAFAFIVSLQLSSAVFTSLALFRLFISAEMPALNLISFVLLISVGSDGAFLLLDVFPPPERLTPITLNKALLHTAKTMFLTQFSTVIPFLLNLLSSVFAFRSFGLFAGLTLIFNYFLLVTFLPAFLVLQSRFLNPCFVRWWPSSCWYCFSGIGGGYSGNSPRFGTQSSQSRCSPPIFKFPLTWLDRFRHFMRLVLDDILPSVLIQGRFVWIGSLLLFLAINIYLIFTQLSLPRYNPLQLFRTSNPHEFYDQNAEQLYPFIVDKIGELPFSIRLVWGIKIIKSDSSLSNYFDLNIDRNQLKQQILLKEDFEHFKLNSPTQLNALAVQISRLQHLKFVNIPVGDKFWPERFIELTSSSNCNTTFSNFSPCCKLFENHRITPISSSIFDHCVRLSTTLLPTGYNDTLIWDKETHKLVGYTALLPTKIVYSHRFSNLSVSFALLDQIIKPIINIDNSLNGWYTTEWGVISQWFDLQRSIINDCEQSFIISFLVVLLFSAIMLRLNAIFATITIVFIVICTLGMLLLLGWEIGVLEAVILVVVVGLSFDYTLHFGATMSSKVCPSHSLQLAIRRAIRPVVMSAISSILAGAVMLFAETHAFFQVGIFLVVCSFLSLLFAIFFFLPLFYFCTTFASKIYQYYFIFLATNIEEKSDKKNPKQKENNCEWCKISQKQNEDVKMKKINKNKNKNNNNKIIRELKDENGTKIAGIFENSVIINNTNNILETPKNRFFSSDISSFVGKLKFDPREEEYEYGDIIKL